MDLDKINLKYLMNKATYEKYAILNPVSQTEYTEDKEFYRKRIVNFTKEMFKETDNLNDLNKNINKNINKVFESYVRHLIVHFKELDRKDILQNDYKDIDFSKPDKNRGCDPSSNQNPERYRHADTLIFKEKREMNKLDGFIIVNNKNPNDKDVCLPIKKEINLKDPKLMRKGIIYRDIKGKRPERPERPDRTNSKVDQESPDQPELPYDTIDIVYRDRRENLETTLR